MSAACRVDSTEAEWTLSLPVPENISPVETVNEHLSTKKTLA